MGSWGKWHQHVYYAALEQTAVGATLGGLEEPWTAGGNAKHVFTCDQALVGSLDHWDGGCAAAAQLRAGGFSVWRLVNLHQTRLAAAEADGVVSAVGLS